MKFFLVFRAELRSLCAARGGYCALDPDSLVEAVWQRAPRLLQRMSRAVPFPSTLSKRKNCSQGGALPPPLATLEHDKRLSMSDKAMVLLGEWVLWILNYRVRDWEARMGPSGLCSSWPDASPKSLFRHLFSVLFAANMVFKGASRLAAQ